MAISITSRIRNAMVGLTVTLCLMFAALIFMLVYVIEDQVFVNQVKIEQAEFEKIIAEGDAQKIHGWQPSNANIQRIDLAENLPTSLPEKAVATVVSSRGVHEYFDDENAMFIASQIQLNNGAPYYLVYDVKNLLVVRDTKRTLLILIGVITLIITLIAAMLARWLTKSTLKPVSRLSKALQSNDLDYAVIELANEFSEDEIGVLTRELAQALELVQESAQREYEFNRGVSHELRSPIQVAQSATELLQLYADESGSKIRKPVDRLQRSIAEMNEVAEAFLWLASDRVVSQSEMCSVASLQNTVTTVQLAYPNQELVINAVTSTSFHYPIPTTVLSVVLRSLVRNAIIHGDPSPIIIDLHAGNMTVTNSVNLVDRESKGFGIGLSIVQRICDRFECELTTQLTSSNRYSSSVVFVQS